MLSPTSSFSVIFAADPIANAEKITPFRMTLKLKWGLIYHQFWTLPPDMCLPHIGLCSVHSLDLLKLTPTLYVLEGSVWP